jgi:hypothetical protein
MVRTSHVARVKTMVVSSKPNAEGTLLDDCNSSSIGLAKMSSLRNVYLALLKYMCLTGTYIDTLVG